ncbi:hypothetical protein Scep_002391 [Stephania cephalantha]|uniref:Uncharacterized protein n=1 Tax=Stephania cephalantha TaxID=152367 RepID=A0AAP0Q4L3_9MAGN
MEQIEQENGETQGENSDTEVDSQSDDTVEVENDRTGQQDEFGEDDLFEENTLQSQIPLHIPSQTQQPQRSVVEIEIEAIQQLFQIKTDLGVSPFGSTDPGESRGKQIISEGVGTSTSSELEILYIGEG